MKLTELMKVSGSQTGSVSSTDLLLKSMFGNNVPTLFIPGAKYEVGDRVYVKDENGDITVYECIKEGIYTEITKDGWKEFDIMNGNMMLATWAAEFIPGGYYFEGDIAYFTSEDGTIRIYICEEEGRYQTVTEGGWSNLAGNTTTGDLLDRDLLEKILKNIYGSGSTPFEFEPNKEYSVGDLVYVIDDNGVIHIKECVIAGTYTDTDNDGWVNVDTTHLNGGGVTLATDKEIIAMFNKNKIPGIDIGEITDTDIGIEIGPNGNGIEIGATKYATNAEIEAMFNGILDMGPGDGSGSGSGSDQDEITVPFNWPDNNRDGSPDTIWTDF